MTDSYTKIFGGKQNILFVFAHPDDAEMYCGGLIARLVTEGKRVKLIKMTTGNKGSRQDTVSETELAKLRESEDAQALLTLGLTQNDSVNMNLGDGEIQDSLVTIEKLVAVIREFKPDIVVTHNPEKVIIRDSNGEFYVNHRDHRHTAMCVVDAVYPYSRDILFFPDQLTNGLESHTVTELLFVDSWDDLDSVAIDITAFETKRTEAIACHASQYSQEKSQSATDYFAPEVEGKRFEQFRYVKID